MALDDRCPSRIRWRVPINIGPRDWQPSSQPTSKQKVIPVDFTLIYRGPLKANGRIGHKQEIRRVFHKQLKILWGQQPLASYARYLSEDRAEGDISVIKKVKEFRFAPLVTKELLLVAHLDVSILRPEEPGSIVTQGGDIDNRLKTLLDSLRMPRNPSELPKNDKPGDSEDPFFILLEDDNLITRISVRTDRLLEPVHDSSDAYILLRVRTAATMRIWGNIDLV